ncbi:hypothetical protein CHS0354_033385 [Potamilus streckersoni]|uniref:Uncharacterized protein n=1 Tax=Potamilus streckersoni TaxID=2493646 RepID=A0AAE0VIX8_9BIVA|nr:hypothetical protein CHS0354_033385 [Potamilus streckersoni]
MLADKAFPRIARQLNYTREFIAPHIARVFIPSLPYEAFNKCRVEPWNMLALFESCRAFTFWPMPHASNPDEAWLDSNVLYRDNSFFIVGTTLKVDPEFNKFESPKFPLFVDSKLEYVGTSSKGIAYSLFHQKRTRPYLVCEIQDVLVNTKTRKPVPYPDWWKAKYANLCKGKQAIPILSTVRPIERGLVTNYVKVTIRDTDTYNHTNWTSYVRFCFDALYENVFESRYNRPLTPLITGGLKHLSASFKKESLAGDILAVESWENPEAEDNVEFEIKKNDELCCHVTMSFFNVKDRESKL